MSYITSSKKFNRFGHCISYVLIDVVEFAKDENSQSLAK